MVQAEGGQETQSQGRVRPATVRVKIQALPYWPELQQELRAGATLYAMSKLIRSRGDLAEQSDLTLAKALDKINIRMRLAGAPAVSLAIGAARTPAEGLKAVQALEWLFTEQV